MIGRKKASCSIVPQQKANYMRPNMHSDIVKVTAFLCLLPAITGCSYGWPQSIKAPDYNANIQKLAVIENLGAIPFRESFNKTLTAMVRSCGAQITFISTQQLPAANSRENSANGASNPNAFDATLSIEVTSFTQVTRFGFAIGEPDSYNYTLSLKDTGGKNVWKALMNFYAGSVVIADKGDVFASEVVAQMNKDKILTGCPHADE